MNFTKRLSTPVHAAQDVKQAVDFITDIFAKNGIKVSLNKKAVDYDPTNLSYIYFRYADPVFKISGEIGFNLVNGKILVDFDANKVFNTGINSETEDKTFTGMPLKNTIKYLNTAGVKFEMYLNQLKKYQAWCEAFLSSLEQVNSLVVKK